MQLAGKFAHAEGYERHTGRFSRMLARPLLEFAALRDGERLLDVGCGTGSLAFTGLASTRRSEIVGIDPSPSFIDYCRSCATDPRISFEVGNALNLPYGGGSFDKCIALLVIQFIPEVRRAIGEMRRVTRPGGAVAACVWSRDDDELHTIFWDAAAELDPETKRTRDARAYAAGQLSALWIESGFTAIEESALTIAPEFESFDEFWIPLTGGQGLAGTYLSGLSPEHQAALRARLREKILGAAADRPFILKAKAWAVRGVK